MRARERGRRPLSIWRSSGCSGSSTAWSRSRRPTRSSRSSWSSSPRRLGSSCPASRWSSRARRPGKGSTSSVALSGRRRTAWPRSAPRARRGSSSTASSPCEESGRWRPERSGRDRSARETCCAPSRPGSTFAFAAFRCTTGRWNERKPGSASRWRFRESSAENFAEATRSSHRVPTPLPTAWTSRSTSSRRSRTGCACTSTTGRPSTTPGSSAPESAGRSSASPRPRWRRAATASSSATGRPWAAASCSTRLLPATQARPASSSSNGATSQRSSTSRSERTR